MVIKENINGYACVCRRKLESKYLLNLRPEIDNTKDKSINQLMTQNELRMKMGRGVEIIEFIGD